MSDYIRRADAMELINKCVSHTSPKAKVMDFRHGEINGLNWACDIIEAMPSADVAPVRHGEWKFDNETDSFFCSECNAEALLKYIVCGGCIQELSEYCPNCGARMDSEEKNCDTCKHYDKGWDDIICDGCTKAHSNWERKDDE